MPHGLMLLKLAISKDARHITSLWFHNCDGSVHMLIAAGVNLCNNTTIIKLAGKTGGCNQSVCV